MTKALPKELIERIQQEYDNITGIVISRDGKPTYAHYFHGYNENDTIHIASVTKSILSILIGIAIDKGFIKGVTQKVLDFFPTYEIKRREKTIQQLTIKHLLTMTAPFKFKSEPYTKVYATEDWTKAVLDLLGGKTLSQDFKYTSIGLQVLSGILIGATKMSVSDFATENLFNPLGIDTPKNFRITNKDEHIAFLKDKFVNGWVIDAKGTNTPGWGLTLTTKDLEKIGRLCLANGKWGEQQIVSSKWVLESTKQQSKMGELPYGYLWWLIKEDRYTSYAAIGDGGNILYVNPNKELVIAITSSFKPRVKDRVEFIRNYVLPIIS